MPRPKFSVPRLVALAVIAPGLVALCLARSAVPAHADGAWSWPLEGTSVGRAFDAPDSPYGPGHRGIDLPGTAGEVVRSVAAGRVTFVGRVAGVPVVTIDHGAERSTYQPVVATVRRGDAVDRGEAIGRLRAEPSHCTSACLHLGRLRGDDYLDPSDLLESASRYRLVDPDGPVPVPAAGSLGSTLAGALGSSLTRPVPGPVTSAFGMRVHPITGVRKLHDGTDFGAPCGTPVKAAAPGVVRRVETVAGYGRWVVVEHTGGAQTRYAHLSAQSVRPGDRVKAGSVLGLVGATGYATGCHLHFMIVKDGHPIDPMS